MKTADILIVDDLPNNLRLLSEMLEKEGYKVRKVTNGQRAIQAAEATPPDLILLDMVMVLNSLLEQHSTSERGEIPVAQSIIERMASSCDRQLNLINSLVETSDSSLQTIQLNVESINLYQFTQKLNTEWQPILMKNQVDLNLQVSDELPKIQADINQLWRVYDNLISNAIKYNPPRLTLTLSAELVPLENQPPEWIKCTVADNGVGIDPVEVPGLFQLYQRGQNVGKIKGLGLGLYLCHQIIQAHGGEIGVQTEPNQGACFWFTLPVSPSEVD